MEVPDIEINKNKRNRSPNQTEIQCFPVDCGKREIFNSWYLSTQSHFGKVPPPAHNFIPICFLRRSKHSGKFPSIVCISGVLLLATLKAPAGNFECEQPSTGNEFEISAASWHILCLELFCDDLCNISTNMCLFLLGMEELISPMMQNGKKDLALLCVVCNPSKQLK